LPVAVAINNDTEIIMIIKPAITWLARVPDAELATGCNTVLKTMADNITLYPNPSPTLAVVQTALDDFTASVAAAADGGQSLTTRKNNSRRALAELMRQLASYVQVACNKDLSSLMLSGFPTHKPVRSPVGALPAPSDVTLTLGARSGELDAGVNPVSGVLTYNWKLTSNAPDAVPQTAQTSAASFTFAGLTPGVIYTVTANAVGTAGPSDWSQTASQMVV
jgi:hypothetical protein